MSTTMTHKEIREKLDTMREPNVCQVSHKIVTAEESWCNGCMIDHDLSTIMRYDGIDAYRKEAASRKRIAINVAQHITILCPDCARRMTEELHDFRSGL